MGPAGCLWALVWIPWDGQIAKHPPCLILTGCGAFRAGKWLLLCSAAAARILLPPRLWLCPWVERAPSCPCYGKSSCEEAFRKHPSK